jgi:transcriptional regulator with XRE-family HTH domain
MLRQVNTFVNINAIGRLTDSGSQIGARLKAAREAAGLTQEDVAEKLRVHAVTVSRWETAGVRARSDTLVRLAELYGLSVDALVSGAARRVSENASDSELSTDVSRGTYAKSRSTRNLPYSVRVYLDELRLRLTKGGADEEEIDRAMQLLRSPSLFTWYSVGTPKELPEEKVLQGMKAVAEHLILPELRSRGRKV